MAARITGSKTFVPRVLSTSEANEMDATMNGMTTVNGSLAWTPDLRDYARWEYGRDAEAWLYSNARRAAAPRRRRPGLKARVRALLRATRSPPPTRGVPVAENRVG